ncbi:MAG: hypothetical protein ACI4NA_04505, partial [Succinivibrio sp.]
MDGRVIASFGADGKAAAPQQARPALELLKDLVSRPSITPEDKGCQVAIAELLAQALDRFDEIAGEDEDAALRKQLRCLLLQPLDHRHRGPVAAGHDDGIGLRPVGAAGEVVGCVGADPAELDRRHEPHHLAV